MIALPALVIVGVGSIVWATAMAYRRKASLLALLLGCVGLSCLAEAVITILELAHFIGEVPGH